MPAKCAKLSQISNFLDDNSAKFVFNKKSSYFRESQRQKLFLIRKVLILVNLSVKNLFLVRKVFILVNHSANLVFK